MQSYPCGKRSGSTSKLYLRRLLIRTDTKEKYYHLDSSSHKRNTRINLLLSVSLVRDIYWLPTVCVFPIASKPRDRLKITEGEKVGENCQKYFTCVVFL